jgi:hypothetical protein
LDIRFFSFDIIKEGNTYYLWLNSWVRAGAITDVLSKEQRFESRMGWSGATEPTPILATKLYNEPIMRN